MNEKRITPITEKDINDIINNSVQGAGNRLVGSAAEQKKLFVRPIANTDGTPNVASMVQQVVAEANDALDEMDNDIAQFKEEVNNDIAQFKEEMQAEATETRGIAEDAKSIALAASSMAFRAENKANEALGEANTAKQNVDSLREYTKGQITAIRTETIAQIDSVRSEVNSSIETLQTSTNQRFSEVEGDISDIQNKDSKRDSKIAQLETGLSEAKTKNNDQDGKISKSERDIETINDLIKNVQFAVSFESYSVMISALSALTPADTKLRVGQNIYIQTQNVPDVWIAEITDSKKDYSYSSDKAFADELRSNNRIQIGHITVSPLEGKTSLDGYAKLTDLEPYAMSEDLKDYTKDSAFQSKVSEFETTIGDLASRLADLEYVPIKVTSFKVKPSNAETGQTLEEVEFEWALNKTPKTLAIGSTGLDTAQSGKTNVDYTDGTDKPKTITYTLSATDERGESATSRTYLYIQNGIYYGGAEKPETYNSAFVLSLNKQLSSGVIDFTADTSDGKHAYYCIPAVLDKGISFTDLDTGLGAAFTKVETFEFENQHGYTTSYNVYESNNAGMGELNIGVK